MLIFPIQVVEALGAPIPENNFYANILGAVLLGIGLALLLEYSREKTGVAGLGIGGAIIINLCAAGVLSLWLEPYVRPDPDHLNERRAVVIEILHRLGEGALPEYYPKEENRGDDWLGLSVFGSVKIEGAQLNDAFCLSLTDKERLLRKQVLDPETYPEFYDPDAPLSGLAIGFVDTNDRDRKVEQLKPHDILR